MTPQAQHDTMPAVRLADLRRRYVKADRDALDVTDLTIPAGGRWALIGPNGSGKTTLLAILAAALAPTAGRVALLGRDVWPATPAERRAARANLGVAFQTPSLDPMLTGLENLRLAATLQGVPRRERARRIEHAADRLGAAELLPRRVARLSGGEQRRLDLARAILHDPALILLDEPTASLDADARDRLESVIAGRPAGVTVLVVTHRLDEADHADRVALLDRGRVALTGEPGALRESLGRRVLHIEHATEADRARASRALREALSPELDPDAAFAPAGLPLSDEPTARRVLAALLEAHLDPRVGLSVRAPTMADVYAAATGHPFTHASEADRSEPPA